MPCLDNQIPFSPQKEHLPSVCGACGTGLQCIVTSLQSEPQHVLPVDLPEAPLAGVDSMQSQLGGHVNGTQHSLQDIRDETAQWLGLPA